MPGAEEGERACRGTLSMIVWQRIPPFSSVLGDLVVLTLYFSSANHAEPYDIGLPYGKPLFDLRPESFDRLPAHFRLFRP